MSFMCTVLYIEKLTGYVLLGMDMLSLACSVSHFLNCLFSSCPNPTTTVPDQIHKKRSRNR